MASSSLGIACGGNNRLAAANFGIQDRCRFAPPCSVVIGDLAWKGRISMSATAYAVARGAVVESRMSIEPYGKREDSNNGGGRDGAAVLEAQERLDTWMKDSVVEIVKNLKEAPLLVQVFSKRKGEVTATSMRTEKQVVLEDWPAVKERWESGETPVTEGVIFVEEIGGEDEEEENSGSDRERTTRAWGIVVQGKGVGCGPVCYLLKTSRVGSGPGSGAGLCSTHFCLVRVKSFRESVESQLKNCWLLQSQWQ
ncbi:hypothetical protein PIB30_048819 [Stylosanthes scabra]|uniref:DUF7804 domain-containing protein n=1 Tax=Stylosanthes scabra TaxID=79078 RepID=A0ABU6RH61_9FABA|nr:hypothetical protein [Stylosanthes scabra]